MISCVGEERVREMKKKKKREEGRDRVLLCEREYNKIMICKVKVIVHIYMVTIAVLHICILLQAPMMWVFYYY